MDEQTQGKQDEREVADLEVTDETAAVKGGAAGDPDEGGQVALKPPARTRLAANCNETVVGA